MNIPARYCTGYLGDIGVPLSDAPMDFSAWFDVYLGGGWHIFDARHNHPRIGRIPMARGRDATDAAITTFGPCQFSGLYRGDGRGGDGVKTNRKFRARAPDFRAADYELGVCKLGPEFCTSCS